MPSTAEKGNAPQALAGERGANAKQREIATVSIPHFEDVSYPGVHDETALALAQLAAGEHGVIHDAHAALELQAMGWPIRVAGVEPSGGVRPVTLWALRAEVIESWPVGAFDEWREWLPQFFDGLHTLRWRAKGEDLAALELVDWFFDDQANQTKAARRALPSSTEYSAIARRVWAGAK